MIKKILILFLLWKLSIFLIALGSAPLLKNEFIFIPQEHRFRSFIQASPLIRTFANFDGASYLTIARDGYLSSQLGYFPFYPWVIKFFSQFTRILFQHTYFVLLAEVISNVAFLFALILFSKMLALDKQKKIGLLLLLIVFLFPTSFYYGAAYNDSLFLLFATLSIYLGRKKHWVLASIIGGIATLTRLNGLALFFFLLAEYFLQMNPDTQFLKKKLNVKAWIQALQKTFSLRKILQDKLIAVFLIPLSFIGYLSYIHVQFGSFYRLFSSMEAWDQDKITFPLQVIWRYIKIIVLYPTFKFNYWIAALEFFSVLLYCFALWYAYKKIRFSYWLFAAVSLLIPWLTGTFQGMPRYGLHLYPLFLALALILQDKSRTVKAIYFALSTLLLVTLLTLFTHGYFVA